MYQDFKDLLSLFNALGVKYLVVGGHAVSFHSQPRATKDLDLLFIKADEKNAHATYTALAAYGASLANITVEDLADPRKFIRFGREPLAIDMMPGIDGVDFDSAREKRVAGRPQDLADLEAIRAAGKIS